MQPLQNVRSSRAGVGGLVAALVALALILSMPGPARAATTYTPTGGSVSFASSLLSFTLRESAQTFSCSSFPLAGSVSSSGTSRAYGADGVSLSLMGTGACHQALCGQALATAQGSGWRLTITGDPIISSSPTWQEWPARIKGVSLTMSCASCTFRLMGVIDGVFEEWSTRFVPKPGASGLVVDGLSPPSGSMCTTLDIQPGDTVEVGGSWSSPSGPVGVSNP